MKCVLNTLYAYVSFNIKFPAHSVFIMCTMSYEINISLGWYSMSLICTEENIFEIVDLENVECRCRRCITNE